MFKLVKNKIIIIGSGFGGLAAGIRLAARGFDVQIFEKRDKPGGRAYVFDLPVPQAGASAQAGKAWFRFDAGPTVITAPFLFEELFSLAGKKLEDYVKLVPLDPFYRIFNHKKEYFDYNSDRDFTLKQIEKFSPEDKQGYLDFIKTTKPIFEKGFVELGDKPFLKFWDMIKVAPDLIKLRSHQSVYKYVSRFIKNDFLRQCFSFHPLLVGGNPFHTTSIYALIHYLELKWGIHYALGGTGALVNALVKLFVELGGKLYLNTGVTEIIIKNRKVHGIKLHDGFEREAEYLISNADFANTYMNMINGSQRKKFSNSKIKNMRHSMSLFVIYFGTKKKYTDTNLKHHNIILGPRYNELLEDIFTRKTLADDFSLYLHKPGETDPSLAPEGCESFYVLSPVPNLASGIDWQMQAKRYRDRIMDFLEENYLPGLKENIVVEHFITPEYFRDELSSYLGSAFSIEPVLTQSAWFRPHNKSEEFENLFLVGAGTHPGAGLPGVLSSAKIVDKLINKH
jgi:phytoene desaturase